MKIAVNTRLLLQNRLEGLGRFSHEVLLRLVKNHPEIEFHFFFDRAFSPEFIYGPNVVPHVLHPQARHPILYIAWFDYAVAGKLRKIQPDLFFSPDGYLCTRTSVKQVPVIHDINFMHFPQYFKPLDLWHYLRYFPQYAQIGERIATVSEFSKQDIIQHYKIPQDRIDVVYNGVDHAFFQPAPEAEREKIRQTVAQGNPYFLFVGGLYPRKNLIELVNAFELYCERYPGSEHLVLAGSGNNRTQPLLDKIAASPVKDRIHLPGRIASKDLPALLSAAEALTFVSSFEGFGLPVLEAQCCGTPVITSPNSALPEIAGEAALYAPHTEPEAIAAAMHRIHSENNLRTRLIAAGFENARRFTWDDTAQRTWKCIEACL